MADIFLPLAKCINLIDLLSEKGWQCNITRTAHGSIWQVEIRRHYGSGVGGYGRAFAPTLEKAVLRAVIDAGMEGLCKDL